MLGIDFIGRCASHQLPLKSFLAPPYVARFGKQSVGVFMFEHLESYPQGFIEAICEFIGVDPVEGVLHAADKRANPRITRDSVERIKLIHRSRAYTKLFRLGTRRDRSRMARIQERFDAHERRAGYRRDSRRLAGSD